MERFWDAMIQMYQKALETEASQYGYNAYAYLARWGDHLAEVAVHRYWTIIAAGGDVSFNADKFFQILDSIS